MKKLLNLYLSFEEGLINRGKTVDRNDSYKICQQKYRKNLNLVRICFVGSFLVFSIFAIRFYLEGNTSHTIFLSLFISLCAVTTPFLASRFNFHVIFPIGLIIVVLLGLMGRTLSTGGISSAIMVWHFSMIMFVVLLLPLKLAKFGLLGVLAELLGIVMIGEFGIIDTSFHATTLVRSFVILTGLIIGTFMLYLIFLENYLLNSAIFKFEKKSLETEKFTKLGQLSGNIAHEIAGPLSTISLATELIQERLNDSHEGHAELKNFVQKIENQTTRMRKIISSLRNFNQNNFLKENSWVELESILNHLLEYTNSHFVDYRQYFKIKNEVGNIKINCIQTLIEQVLTNLIKNSMFEIKGHERPFVHLDIYRDNLTLYFKITDSGASPSKEFAKKMMGPFFSTKGKEGGSGVGLDLCQKILKRHGGALAINHKHFNTQFIMSLPLEAIDSSVA